MPAERAKRTPAASTATPVGSKRGKAPSAMAKTIADAATALPPKTLQALLKKELLPLADATFTAEQQELVHSAFKAALSTQVEDTGYSRLINLEGRQKLLERKLKAFEADVKRNWKYGYEEHHDMLKEMCNIMVAWCKDIYAAIVEGKAEKEIGTAHKSLMCMKGVVQKLRESNNRAEFETEDWYEEYKIQGTNNEPRYNEEYMNVLLLKLWRDILLTAIDIGGKTNEKLVKQIIPAAVRTKKEPKYGYSGGCDANLWHILRPVGDTSVETEVSVGTGPYRTKIIKWDDEWHSEGMKAALPRLLELVDELVPQEKRVITSE